MQRSQLLAADRVCCMSRAALSGPAGPGPAGRGGGAMMVRGGGGSVVVVMYGARVRGGGNDDSSVEMCQDVQVAEPVRGWAPAWCKAGQTSPNC